jgi:signal transduction histidine kinase
MTRNISDDVTIKSSILQSFCLSALFILTTLQATAQRANIYDSISVIENNLDPEQTLKSIDVSLLLFRNSKNRQINFGFTGCEYHYIILKISASGALPDQYLSIDNTSLDTITIYKISYHGPPQLLYRGGLLVAYNRERNYVWHSVPLDVSPMPSYYFIAAKASQKNINIRYEINDRDVLQDKYEKYERFVFFYIGVASMIAAIILIAFLLFKKKAFAGYLGYFLCMSVWILAHYGCLFPLLYPDLPAFNHIIKPLSSLGAAVFLLLVMGNIFETELLSQPWYWRLIRTFKTVLLILTGLMLLLFIPNLNTIIKASLITTWHLGLLASVCIIVWIPLKFFYTGNLAKIFSAAILIICATVIVQLFANAGMIDNYFINEHGMAFGSLLENSIMAFGLFVGLLEERRNRNLQVLALEAEQTATLKKLIAVQDNERKRIAGDLHDNIGPLLAALKINFRRIANVKDQQKQLELVQKTEDIIDDSIIEIRNVAHNLMPKNLSSNGLINTLSDYFEDMEQLYSKKIMFNHHVQSIFEPEMQMNIYRIISELVMNADKHSDADMITVCISSESKQLSIFIQDNGQGFEVKHNGSKNSLGIQSAESRVHYLKGNFKLKSEPGKGTKVNIEIPL